MAVVYRARDLLLGRIVVLKILQPQFAQDPDFLTRFRKEAQAAACLCHPNIVNVYDVGEANGVSYLVMEYVEGKNLKEIIKERGALPVTEALALAIQFSEALQHAHEKGVIHCDVKPHNILVTPGGRAKVADFGIARAAAAATLTPPGVVLGSVPYLSPEQARGEPATEKSDLYAAGVVLYEMLTGEVPFKGETPVAVALKHIQAEPPPLRKLNPAVPPVLEQVVLRLLAKDPTLRYPSFQALGSELSQLKNFPLDAPTQPLTALGNFPKGEKTNLLTPLYPPQAKERLSPGPGAKRKPRTWAWVLFSILLAVAVFLGLYLGWQAYWTVGETAVPSVEGKPLGIAEQILSEAGLKPRLGKQLYDRQVPPGYVIKQSIPPYKEVKQGREVFLDVSLGPALTEVPSLYGKTKQEAQALLENEGLVMEEGVEIYHNEVPAGAVVSQIPPPHSKQPQGTVVRVVLSKGKEPSLLVMPDLRGKTLEEAKEEIAKMNLVLGGIQSEESNVYPAGKVTAQSIAPESKVLQGETVVLTVSKGPGPPLQKARVSLTLPADGQEHEVRIVVNDSEGAREAYQGTHAPEEFLVKEIDFYGQGELEVYLDGEKVYTRSLP